MRHQPRAYRPTIWPVLLAYLCAFAIALCASALLVLGVALARAHGKVAGVAEQASGFALSAEGLMASALVDACVLVGVAAVASRLPARDALGLALGPSRASRLGLAAAVAGMIGLSFACGALTDLFGARSGTVMDALAKALHAPSPLRFFIAVATVGVGPGVAEETFFRGFMQRRIRARWGRLAAIAVTAAAFAVIHLDPVQGASAFAAGLFLGWVAERLQGTRPGILAHAGNNALFVALASFASTEGGSRGAEVAVLAAGSLVLVAAILLLARPGAIRAPPRVIAPEAPANAEG